MRFDKGWVKVWRALDDHWIGSDGTALAIFIKILWWANWKDSIKAVPGNKGPVTVKRGELLTSANQIADRLGFHRRTVEKRLEWLEKEGVILQKVTMQGRKITICNYEKYQDSENDIGKQSSNAVLDECPTVDTTPYQSSATLLKNLRIKEGKEKKEGKKDLIIAEGATPTTAVVKKETRPKVPKEPTKGSLVWESYSKAYALKYGSAPARNAKENALCSTFVERVGAEDAPRIAEFYLSHHDRWYTQKLHPLSLMVSDAQKLRTEWLAGAMMTGHLAKKSEVESQNDEVIKRWIERTKA